ncbi:MAG: 16S rRNA (uracil(1498)-N(3))-methyltransferase [Oceanospirillaceae bacterium]
MRIPRFYQNCILQVNTTIDLEDSTVQHIARVLRMRIGEKIQLFNNDGLEYLAQLTIVEKRSVSANIISSSDPQRTSPLNIEIGQAISRGDRMDYALQKATELGMNGLTPLLSERGEVKLKADRLAKKQLQWQQLAISACEQSLRTQIPVIRETCTLTQWINSCEAEVKLVLHHHTAKSLGDFAPPKSVALLIGPEGGLTEQEVEAAINAGFQPVALGPRVMRTETAPVAALAILQYLWGDLA